MKKKAKRVQNKEEIAEDWCFSCKDGGLLLVCDYKKCLKSYHAECVEKDDSFSESRSHWTCKWHSCFICHKSSKFQCFCCPNSVCQRCIAAAEFARVRGNKGFCNDCLKLALLGEENMDVDSDGERVDFKDRETYEGLFFEYWEIIKEKEGLTLEHLHSADAQLKKGENCKSDSDPDESDKEEETQLMSDSDSEDDIEEHRPVHKRKRSRGKQLAVKREVNSNTREFVGWGSKSLIGFLASIGKDTSKKLSQHDVSSIVRGYINENKLFHPQKKRKIICDDRLKSVLGRRAVDRNKIYDLLESHFLENVEPPVEIELGYSSEDKDENVLVSCKKHRKSNACSKSQEREVVFDAPQSCFASIVAENIKLAYLKRSLVQELVKQPETFESKVLGSFVRVKSDSSSQRNSHQLVQITGMKKVSVRENNTEILFQVSNMSKDIHINMLSDDNFSEEECEDLRQKVKGGLLRKPTIAELEQKARSLHEDITKHWIVRELVLLQNLIDRANEKGWRSVLFDYLERRRLLQTPSEQLRLLQKVPQVIADVAELEPMDEDAIKEYRQGDQNLSKSILMGSSETPDDKWGGFGISSGNGAATNGNSSFRNIESSSANDGNGNAQETQGNTAGSNIQVAEETEHHSSVSIPEVKQGYTTETRILEELPQQSHILVPQILDNIILEREPGQTIPEEKQKHSKASIIEELAKQSHASENQSNVILQGEPHQSSSHIDGQEQSQPKDSEQKMTRNQEASVG